MGRKVAISQPAVIQTELRPLDESFWIDANGALEQWCYQNTGAFAPDRQITPLKLTPHLSSIDPDTQYEYNINDNKCWVITHWDEQTQQWVTETTQIQAFSIDKWIVKEWNGSTWVTTEVTALSTASYYYIDQDGISLVVTKNNFDGTHAINITCKAKYNDPRDVGVQRWVQESVMLVTNVDAKQVYPDIDILNPSARMYNPLRDESPIFEFEGKADWDAIDSQGAAITEYKVDPLGTESVLPTNEDGIVNAAPLLDITYGNTPKTSQQFMERQVSGGLVNPISDGVAKIENIKGDTVKVVQLALNPNFKDTSYWNPSNGTVAAANNILTYTVNEANNGISIIQSVNCQDISSHKYYAKVNLNYSQKSTYTETGFFGIGGYYGISWNISDIVAGQWFTYSGLFTSNGEARDKRLEFYLRTQGMSQGSTVKISNIVFLDLTLMGIDNLTTTEEVESWLESHLGKLDYIPYTAGKLVNYGGYAVKWNQLDKGNVVDMGLPSGTLWSIANLDATTQSGFAEIDGKPSPFKYECTFFSWGNKDGHNPISNSAFDYDWGSSNSGPYASTQGATLTSDVPLSFDAARAILGAPWREPSTEDFAELFNNIDYVDANGDVISGTNKLTTVNNITGIRLKSKNNGNIIFFPCSGNGNGQSWYSRGSYGLYWSRSLYSQTSGRNLNFNSGGVSPQDNSDRFFGFAHRAVTTPISTDDGYHKYFSKDKTIIDLTLMFGEGNEPDLDWCNKYLSRDYYEYCPSLDRNILDVMEEKTIVDGVAQYSHPAMGMKTVGFNQWDEQWVNGYVDSATGNVIENFSTTIASKNLVPVVHDETYYFKGTGYITMYDANQAVVGQVIKSNDTFDIEANVRYIRFHIDNYGSTYNHDICINVSDPAKNGTYEPYWSSFSDMSWIRKIGIPDFNIWDEEMESGYLGYEPNNMGEPKANANTLRSKNFISVKEGTVYYKTYADSSHSYVWTYDASKNPIGLIDCGSGHNILMPSGCAYIKFCTEPAYGTTYNHDICINVSNLHFNGRYYPHGMTAPYFPNGLCNVGSVYDEVKVENGKIKGVVRFGDIDLGNLGWTTEAIPSGYRLASSVVLGCKPPQTTTELSDARCSKYKIVTPNDSYYGAVGLSIDTDSSLRVFDTNYNTASPENFKKDIIGTHLVFELATPYEFEIDYPTKGQFEWYGVNGSGQETPIDQLPVYTQATQPSGYGQHTSRININALYGEDIAVILRVKRYPWSDSVLPPKVTKSVAWRVPHLDVVIVSDIGSSVRAQNLSSNFTFSTIINDIDGVISDDIKSANMVFDWYYVKYGTDGSAQSPQSLGSGLTKTVAASVLKNTTPPSGSTPSTNVYCEAFVLGAYHLVNGVYVRTKD